MLLGSDACTARSIDGDCDFRKEGFEQKSVRDDADIGAEADELDLERQMAMDPAELIAEG